RIPVTLQGQARVDVNSAFYRTIRWVYGTLDALDKAHTALEKRICEISYKAQLFLYIDGHQSVKKLLATQLRESVR
ncbi:hypothetical protein BGW41_007946, partial [Actinomortierella wolfii]